MAEASGLPLLRSPFFKSHTAKADFWAKWQSAGTWSAEFCPIYEWEQVLFIGCTSNETPPPVNLTQKFVMVLCEPEHLQTFFAQLTQLVVSPVAAAPLIASVPASVPAGIPASAPVSAPSDDPFAGMISDSDVAEEVLLKGGEEGSEESAEVKESFEGLVGLSEETGPPVSFLTPLTPVTTTDVAPEAVAKVAIEATPSAAPQPAAVAVASPVIETVQPPAPVVEALAVAPKPTAPPVKSDTAVDEFTLNIFKQMRTHFQKSMLFRKEGNALIPWKWDVEFNSHTPPTESHISLGQPSPFRIVTKTHKPFHGYLSPCEIAEKFFEDWNSSQIPDHLTLVPIQIEDQLMGVLLGIAEKSVNQKASLILAERLASEVESSIKSNNQSLAS